MYTNAQQDGSTTLSEEPVPVHRAHTPPFLPDEDVSPFCPSLEDNITSVDSGSFRPHDGAAGASPEGHGRSLLHNNTRAPTECFFEFTDGVVRERVSVDDESDDSVRASLRTLPPRSGSVDRHPSLSGASPVGLPDSSASERSSLGTITAPPSTFPWASRGPSGVTPPAALGERWRTRRTPSPPLLVPPLPPPPPPHARVRTVSRESTSLLPTFTSSPTPERLSATAAPRHMLPETSPIGEPILSPLQPSASHLIPAARTTTSTPTTTSSPAQAAPAATSPSVSAEGLARPLWELYLEQVRRTVCDPSSTLQEREAAMSTLASKADRLFTLADTPGGVSPHSRTPPLFSPAASPPEATSFPPPQPSPPAGRLRRESTASECFSMITIMQLDASLTGLDRARVTSGASEEGDLMSSNLATSRATSSTRSSQAGLAMTSDRARSPGMYTRVRRSSHTMSRDGTELINEYSVRELLGRGTTGCVFLCVHRHTKVAYAIKSVAKTKKPAFGGHGYFPPRRSSESVGTVVVGTPSEGSTSTRFRGVSARGRSPSALVRARGQSGGTPVPDLPQRTSGLAGAATTAGDVGASRARGEARLDSAQPPNATRLHVTGTTISDSDSATFSTRVVPLPSPDLSANAVPLVEALLIEDSSGSFQGRRVMRLATVQPTEGSVAGSPASTPWQTPSMSANRPGQAVQRGAVQTPTAQPLWSGAVVQRGILSDPATGAPQDRPGTSSMPSVGPTSIHPMAGSLVSRAARVAAGSSMRSNIVIASAPPQSLEAPALPAFTRVSQSSGFRPTTSGDGPAADAEAMVLWDELSPVTGAANSATAHGLRDGAVTGGGSNRTAVDVLCPVEREIRVLRRLRHPNIVRLHEVIDDEDEAVVHLVLDYLPRGPVTRVQAYDHATGFAHCDPIRPLSRLQLLMRQLTDALHHLQRRCVVHNDLKPDNILLDDHDDLVLTDFGESILLPQNLVKQDMNASVVAGNANKWNVLAQQSFSQGIHSLLPDGVAGSQRELLAHDMLQQPYRSISTPSALDWLQPDSSMYLQHGVDLNGKLRGRVGAGTPAFCAPELVDRNECGFKSDVWSVGVILFSFLFGRLPFAGPTARDTFDAVLHAELVFPPMDEIPCHEEFTESSLAAWQDLCRQLLVRSPAQRMSLRALMAHPLIRASAGFPLPPLAPVLSDTHATPSTSPVGLSSRTQSPTRAQRWASKARSPHQAATAAWPDPKVSPHPDVQRRPSLPSDSCVPFNLPHRSGVEDAAECSGVTLISVSSLHASAVATTPSSPPRVERFSPKEREAPPPPLGADTLTIQEMPAHGSDAQESCATSTDASPSFQTMDRIMTLSSTRAPRLPRSPSGSPSIGAVPLIIGGAVSHGNSVVFVDSDGALLPANGHKVSAARRFPSTDTCGGASVVTDAPDRAGTSTASTMPYSPHRACSSHTDSVSESTTSSNSSSGSSSVTQRGTGTSSRGSSSGGGRRRRQQIRGGSPTEAPLALSVDSALGVDEDTAANGLKPLAPFLPPPLVLRPHCRPHDGDAVATATGQSAARYPSLATPSRLQRVSQPANQEERVGREESDPAVARATSRPMEDDPQADTGSVSRRSVRPSSSSASGGQMSGLVGEELPLRSPSFPKLTHSPARSPSSPQRLLGVLPVGGLRLRTLWRSSSAKSEAKRRQPFPETPKEGASVRQGETEDLLADSTVARKAA